MESLPEPAAYETEVSLQRMIQVYFDHVLPSLDCSREELLEAISMILVSHIHGGRHYAYIRTKNGGSRRYLLQVSRKPTKWHLCGGKT